MGMPLIIQLLLLLFVTLFLLLSEFLPEMSYFLF